MSDNDLIRRGDALYAIAGWEIPSTAIAALPARGVGVKPLVWKREADNAWVAAHYAIQQYWPHNNGPFAVSGWYLSGLGVISLGKHPTLEAAKAAAQADYEARILAALEPAPTDAAQARVIRNGEHLFNTAKPLGWADDGEGALEFVMRRTREVALEDAAQAREVALREAVAKATEHMDMHNGRDMNSYRAALGVRDAILALIGEKPREQRE